MSFSLIVSSYCRLKITQTCMNLEDGGVLRLLPYIPGVHRSKGGSHTTLVALLEPGKVCAWLFAELASDMDND
jgi:hypothetical protein